MDLENKTHLFVFYKKYTSPTQIESEKVGKKILYAKGKENKAGIAILTPDKIEFTTKTILKR